MNCAYCNKKATGEYSVHRDGFCEGPEVELCNACGSSTLPTLHDIWNKIRATPNLAKAKKLISKLEDEDLFALSRWMKDEGYLMFPSTSSYKKSY